VEVVTIFKWRIQKRKVSANVNFCGFVSIECITGRVKRITVAGALAEAAICSIITTVTQATSIQGTVPGFFICGHVSGVIVIKVFYLAGAVSFINARSYFTTRGIAFCVDLDRHCTGVVLSKVGVILADTMSRAVVRASCTLTS
jgi:hypothetical protein